MTSGHPRSADLATLIDRYDAALNAHDRDAITSMHDDAIVFHNHRPESASRARQRDAPTPARSSRAGQRRRLRGEEWTARPCTPTTVANWNRTTSTSSPSPPTAARATTSTR